MISKKVLGVRTRHLIGGQEKSGPKLAFLKNMHFFVKDFNNKTCGDKLEGKILTTKITLFNDGSYEYRVVGVPSTYLLKELIKTTGTINTQQLLELSKNLIDYLNTEESDKAYKTLLGTTKSLNIKVSEH